MRSSKTRDKDILAMAKVVQYGTSWVADFEPCAYRAAAHETVAHIVACWLCQEHSHESEPTKDVLDELGLEDAGHRPVRFWYTRLKQMVKRREGVHK